MRNYELVRVLYEELTTGDGKGSFNNPYLNTVITLAKLIEEERPEMKDAATIQPGWSGCPIGSAIVGPLGVKENSKLEETRFE